MVQLPDPCLIFILPLETLFEIPGCIPGKLRIEQNLCIHNLQYRKYSYLISVDLRRVPTCI